MKKILFVMMIFFCSLGAFAQGRHNHEARMKDVVEFKIKYLAQEMGLNEEQTQRFADLYTQMSDEKMKLFKEVKALERKVEKNPKSTEADYEALRVAQNSAKARDAEIDAKYDALFAKFLTSKQIVKMKNAEGQFRKKMREMRRKNRKK